MACINLLGVWNALENAASDTKSATIMPGSSPQALNAVRKAIEDAYDPYLRRHGKRRWCDKSLESAATAEVLARVFPDAKFICLYRHCMDVIASGVEACPWGISRHGFDPFVAQYPGNSVAAIGKYWLTAAHAIMAFEETHPQACHRVRYEDLVTTPERTADDIFAFLGAARAPGITQACFETEHEGNGAGDEKIWFTTKITSDSIGRGVAVPANALPPPLLTGINAALAKLDYRVVDNRWNLAPGPVDPRAGTGATATAANRRHQSSRQELEGAVNAIRDRISSRPDARDEVTARWPMLAGQTIALVIHDSGGENSELRISFEPVQTAEKDSKKGVTPSTDHSGSSTEDGGDPIATLIASPATWKALLDGEANIVKEMFTGGVRSFNRRDSYRLRSAEINAVVALLGISHVPLAHTSG
jgi:hypothetical protein